MSSRLFFVLLSLASFLPSNMCHDLILFCLIFLAKSQSGKFSSEVSVSICSTTAWSRFWTCVPIINSAWKHNLDRVRARKGRRPLTLSGAVHTQLMTWAGKNHHSYTSASLERCRDEETKCRIISGKTTFHKEGGRREFSGGRWGWSRQVHPKVQWT